ncbi:MAG: Lrp/AsnC family transcriptional regulator [Acidimicrobiales bacterium]
MSGDLDPIDRALIRELRRRPRGSLTDLATSVGIARGTAYSRLDRLSDTGVVRGFGPDLDAKAAGFPVTAFCTLEISQGTHHETVDALAAIPEVIEIFTVTGIGDLLCKVVARSNDDLHAVLLRITTVPSVQRSQTQLALQSAHTRHLSELL